MARHLYGARRRNREHSISELLRKVMEERAKRVQLERIRRKNQQKPKQPASVN